MDVADEFQMIGTVIDQCNHIETLFKEIIIAYVRPENSKVAFFDRYVLNTAVMSFSAKAKLVQGINSQEKLVNLDRNKIHRFLGIRNAFAHHDIISGIQLDVDEKGNVDPDAYLVVESMKSDGSMETIERKKAYGEFNRIFCELEPALLEMLRKLGPVRTMSSNPRLEADAP